MTKTVIIKNVKINYLENSLCVQSIEYEGQIGVPKGRLYYVGTDKVAAFYSQIASGNSSDTRNAMFEERLKLAVTEGKMLELFMFAKRYFEEGKDEAESDEDSGQGKVAFPRKYVRRSV